MMVRISHWSQIYSTRLEVHKKSNLCAQIFTESSSTVNQSKQRGYILINRKYLKTAVTKKFCNEYNCFTIGKELAQEGEFPCIVQPTGLHAEKYSTQNRLQLFLAVVIYSNQNFIQAFGNIMYLVSARLCC